MVIMVIIITIYTNLTKRYLIPYLWCRECLWHEHSASCKRFAREVSPARSASTRHTASTFPLVVGASGLCTPGPVRSTVCTVSCTVLPAGVCRAAPAQVTSCKVVTVSCFYFQLLKFLTLHLR